MGVALGSRMKTFEGFGVVSNFVVLPLYFLSGGIFPPEGLPDWMRALVVALNPVTYGVDWMRAVIGQPHVFNGGVDALATRRIRPGRGAGGDARRLVAQFDAPPFAGGGARTRACRVREATSVRQS